jgi:hypothetical protein
VLADRRPYRHQHHQRDDARQEQHQAAIGVVHLRGPAHVVGIGMDERKGCDQEGQRRAIEPGHDGFVPGHQPGQRQGG